jgi:hypothetical protein
VPNVNEANVSQQRSSCTSTELPVDNAVETSQQRYSMDEITQRTPCALQSKHKGIIFMVGYGIVAPTQPGDVYHGQLIHVGYAKVDVKECARIMRRSSSTFLEVMGRRH